MQTAVLRLVQAIRGATLDVVSAEELTLVIESLRDAQATIESGLLRCGIRADELARDGRAAPARDALLGSGRVRGATARREARRAELAGRSPELSSALTDDRLGPDHLDALVRRLGGLDDDQLARLDLSSLLDGRAHRLPADTFDAALRRAVDSAIDNHGTAEATAKRQESEVRHWFDERTGLGHLSGRFDAERYEALTTALDQQTVALAATGGETVQKNANLAAEALVDLVCRSGGRQRHLPHITVVVDQETLEHGRNSATIAQTGNGHDLSDAAVARLCCDAVLQRVVLDEHGVPIDVGRRHRTATATQWTALRAIHSSCAWIGCDRRLDHCQAHHITYWQRRGPTDLDNLIPLCSHHHHLVHEGRWRIELLAGRALAITRPDGQRHGTTGPPTRRPPPPLVGHRSLTTA